MRKSTKRTNKYKVQEHLTRTTTPECTKVRYRTEKSARRALHNQMRWGAQVKRTYFCRECGSYHLTSSSTPMGKGSNNQRGTPYSRKNKKYRQEFKQGFQTGISNRDFKQGMHYA